MFICLFLSPFLSFLLSFFLFSEKSQINSKNKWYKKTGCIFEFYDSQDKVSPLKCDRKGKARKIADWRKQVHAIADFNWSACFTLLFIQNEVY